MKVLIAAAALLWASSTFASIATLSYVIYGVEFVQTHFLPKELVVKASGTGKTQEEAINNAILQSVQKGLGVMVVSDLTVENERVVRDLAAMYSSGIVQTYEVNGCTQTKHFTCEVTAVVLPWELERKASVNAIKGADLYASYITSKNTLIQRRKIIEYYFSRIRENGLEAKLQSIRIIPTTGEKPKVELKYSVQWNRKFRAEFISFLERLEKDTNASFDNHDLVLQWTSSNLFKNRVFLHTNDEATRILIEKELYKPVFVRFEELNLCRRIDLDASILGFGVYNRDIVEVDVNRLKEMKKLTASMGCDNK